MKEVRWTETAKNTFRETSEFILSLWNISVNEKFLDQLEYRIGQLKHNPELGPPVVGIGLFHYITAF
tara:strand:- start:980 stop:1180 length:201 start_codon:yes stop_codon:yes gene_type:complete